MTHFFASTDSECVNFTTLSGMSRSRFFSNNLTTDSDLYLKSWFAFNGSAGDLIATSCVASNHCGTSVPGWMLGRHPSVVEGVVRRSACFSQKQQCCMYSLSMRVRNCSSFYVYKLDSMPSLSVSFRLCGAGIEGTANTVWTNVHLLFRLKRNSSDECSSYQSLEGRDRAANYFSYNTMKCDANLPRTWYRFTGAAGAVMPTHCVPKLHCGTLSPGWLNGKHPTVEEGVVERMVCFTNNDDCCFWYSEVRVRNCSDFIVYNFGEFPASQPFCSLRYCGVGKTGCKDKHGNVYEVHEKWSPNPLINCKCLPGFKVECKKTQSGCWDSLGNAFANGQEWLSSSLTKCACTDEQIHCTNLSRPACTDENGLVREHGTNWFPGPCFNCSCTDGVISCVKYDVTVEYGSFRMTTAGSCLPCLRPNVDIRPSGPGTVSNCKVFFQLKNSNELFHCSNDAFIRKEHVCNGNAECLDGSDEANCHDVICGDEQGQVLILKEVWKVTECIECRCEAGLLKCKRLLKVVFPGMYGYAPLTEKCEQPSCNTVDFIRERKHTCEGIETTEGGRIILRDKTWEYQDCKFTFRELRSDRRRCPEMLGPTCDMYDGAICCAQKCPALAELTSQMRGMPQLCPGGLQAVVSGSTCVTPEPNCLLGHDFCKTNISCQDENANTYFEGAQWFVPDCITCRCNNGLISCEQRVTFLTSSDGLVENCTQPKCNVVAFVKTNRGICKGKYIAKPLLNSENFACRWKNQVLFDGHRWSVNDVDFFCFSGERVRPGCYLEADKINCTGAFKGIQDVSHISEELFLCDSGDEIRPLNERCNKIDECNDKSDEKDCIHYFCPSQTKFNLKWNRTSVGTVVYRNCSNVESKLEGQFSSRCTESSSRTSWKHKASCDCERQAILQRVRLKLSSANLTNLVELTGDLKKEASNFTNKRQFFSYLKDLFQTGMRLLRPISQRNDMVVLNFSKANESHVPLRLEYANCSWVEYDENGTLQIKSKEIMDEQKYRKALIRGYLDLALSSISIMAVIISLIALSFLRIRNSERIFVHKNLLLSLCLVYIVTIFDSFVFTNRKQNPKLCSFMAVFQHFSHTTIFTWMLVEGIHLYVKLVKVFSVQKLYITYVIIGWGIPVIIVGLVAAIRPLTYDMTTTYYKEVMCGTLKLPVEIIRTRCWLHDGEWLYKAPILTMLSINVIIFVVLLRVIFTKISIKYHSNHVQKAKRGIRSIAALLPLLGVTWLLGIVAELNEIIQYLFIILNSLQGLLFCIFHGLLDDQVNLTCIAMSATRRLSWSMMLTVEPVLFFYAFGFFMNIPIAQQYVYKRLSEAKGFPYHFQQDDGDTGCGSKLNDTMKKLEKEVQTYASYVQLGIVMFSALPSIIITLFMGGWSDKVGRRPTLIVPVLGGVLDTAGVLIVMIFELPIYFLFVGAFLHGLCGYYTTIILACMSYIADTTDQTQITLRLSIMELVVFLGGMVAQLSSGLWIEKLGFTPPFWFILACHVTSLLYAIFIVPESRVKSTSERGKLFSLDNFKSSWRVYHEASGFTKRNLVILTASVGITDLAVMSTSSVMNLYTLHSPLCFTPEYVGYFSAFRQFMHGAGGVTAIKAFGMCLADVNVARIALLSYLGFLVMLGFSETLLLVFLSPVVGIFGGAGPPVLRGMMSKIVSLDDQGSLFSAVSSVEMLCTFVGTAMLNSLYPKSLKFNAPGFVFFLAGIFLLLPFAFTL
ncbi:unnamed protein product [Porites lobata]|uniref:G-protein coupled receptors family 2 profile 2 domain-containing protein n=1 Tax=Porites lobata TaxID=104759 RepID=A0ABN8NWY8_9CNID|nr:unnamed protein product [Porites lobata]